MSQKKHLSSNLKLDISTENEMLKDEDSIKITSDDNQNHFQQTYDVFNKNNFLHNENMFYLKKIIKRNYKY